MILLACKINNAFSKQNKTKQKCGLESSCWHIEQFFDAKTVFCNSTMDMENFIIELKPEIVIVQAIWAEPMNMSYLVNTYPKIHFAVQIRSDIPFLATDWDAIEYIGQYYRNGIEVIFNSGSAADALDDSNLLGKATYLPNLYKIETIERSRVIKNCIDIACFGAIRPMKNILIQAMAAIQVANSKNMPLRFHINSSRIEGGDATLNNVRSLFKFSPKHELVEVPWMERLEMLEYICKMDLGLQVSMTESFNMATADFVSQMVPVVVSQSIAWITMEEEVATDCMIGISKAIYNRLGNRDAAKLNLSELQMHNEEAIKDWNEWLESRTSQHLKK